MIISWISKQEFNDFSIFFRFCARSDIQNIRLVNKELSEAITRAISIKARFHDDTNYFSRSLFHSGIWIVSFPRELSTSMLVLRQLNHLQYQKLTIGYNALSSLITGHSENSDNVVTLCQYLSN